MLEEKQKETEEFDIGSMVEDISAAFQLLRNGSLRTNKTHGRSNVPSLSPKGEIYGQPWPDNCGLHTEHSVPPSQVKHKPSNTELGLYNRLQSFGVMGNFVTVASKPPKPAHPFYAPVASSNSMRRTSAVTSELNVKNTSTSESSRDSHESPSPQRPVQQVKEFGSFTRSESPAATSSAHVRQSEEVVSIPLAKVYQTAAGHKYGGETSFAQNSDDQTQAPSKTYLYRRPLEGVPVSSATQTEFPSNSQDYAPQTVDSGSKPLDTRNCGCPVVNFQNLREDVAEGPTALKHGHKDRWNYSPRLGSEAGCLPASNGEAFQRADFLTCNLQGGSKEHLLSQSTVMRVCVADWPLEKVPFTEYYSKFQYFESYLSCIVTGVFFLPP
jgi:hypothetical protein